MDDTFKQALALTEQAVADQCDDKLKEVAGRETLNANYWKAKYEAEAAQSMLAGSQLSALRLQLKDAQSAVSASGAKRLWLWKNFVDGRPEYWAFDNPYPCKPGGGDPITLGEPCGYAIFKESSQGRFDVPEDQVIAAIKRASVDRTSQDAATDSSSAPTSTRRN